MEAVAEIDGFDMSSFTPMYCELNSFDSVRKFCDCVEEFRLSKPIDRLICNAGVYQPSLPDAKWSLDNHEQTMQINFLSHFLMISQFLNALQESNDPRVIMVGSVTGNDNTVGGGGVYPIADLHELDGMKAGFTNPIAMADGYGFIGAKAYKDSKLCLMMMANLLHTKYHKLTRISFSSMYPGCIAESPLFREKRAWFRKYFPIFMKFITGGFVSEHEAGQRLFQVAHDPRCSKSGVYWSWNGGPREGRGVEAIEKGGQISGGGGAGGGWDSIFENDQSSKVLDVDKSIKLFDYSTAITGAVWPDLKQIRSPCPTLNVIGAVTKGMVKREELKRMREMGRPGILPASAEPVKLSAKTKAVLVADKVVSNTLSNTIGRIARFAGKRVLGAFPEEAVTGSFVVEADTNNDISEAASQETTTITSVDQKELMDELSQQLGANPILDDADAALFQQLYDDEKAKVAVPVGAGQSNLKEENVKSNGLSA
jgi:light-dependent protochlorophyllide reductase